LLEGVKYIKCEIKVSAVKLFETKKVRSSYDAVKEKWYFSVIDIIEI